LKNMLQQNELGTTGLKVTDYCLGVLPMGPLQSGLPEKNCLEIIKKALDLGVNFFDTAEGYKTQPYMGQFLAKNRGDLVVATKSHAKTYDEMAASVEKSLTEMQTDYIDIYHLHCVKDGIEVFEERIGALQKLNQLKQQQVIRSVGMATHNVKVVDAAADRDDVDILFALVNRSGMGIVGGTTAQMVAAIEKAANAGKGVYAMKALAGGNLLSEYHDALSWARRLKGISSVSVGVVSIKELLQNLKHFGVRTPETEEVSSEITKKEKKLFILERLCTGCGACVEACPNEALFLEGEKAKVNHENCILCGYCSPECSDFLIRLT